MAAAALLQGTFRGEVRIRTHHGGNMGARYGGGLFGFLGNTLQLDCRADSLIWQMRPSPRGGYFISYASNGQTLFWQCNHDNGKRMQLHNGADDWESFIVESHPMGGYAFKSISSHGYFCAEPSGHMIADRSHKQAWEQFQIEIVSSNTPPPPVAQRTGPQPFVHTCGHVHGHCSGGFPGERHVLFSNAPSNARICPNPQCKAEIMEMSHIHA